MENEKKDVVQEVIPPQEKKTAKKKKAVKKVEEVKDLITLENEEQRKLVEEIQNSIPQVFDQAQRNLLLNETPRYKIRKRQGKGGMTFDYVDIGYVLEQLNILTGHRWDFDIEWQTSLTEAKEVGQFIVRGSLKLYSNKGDIVKKTNFGKADLKERKGGGYLDFGNDMKGAVSDCVKKCASMFGIALDVYSGAVKRRQDENHPEAPITDTQRMRLETLAQEAKIGHSGLKKLIFEKFDYTSTAFIQRRHFVDISNAIEVKASEVTEDVIPEDIAKGFDILSIPQGKRIAIYRSYKKQDKLEELKKRLNAKIDEKQAKDEEEKL